MMLQRSAPKKSAVLAASFLLPAAVMTVVFALCGLCPFGTRTLGVMDMTHQYLSFLYSLRDILAGKASLLYLPSMCLGGNMLGVAAYYLTSPLNLLTCLFPRAYMYQAVSLLYILRVGLCGLTMTIYTGNRNGYSWRCLVAAMAYGFMAYMVAYCFNYLWQDCVILLPIIALGLHRLTQGRGRWLYVLALAGALWLNFYIGYILCIFSVLFFLYEWFSQPRAQREHTWKTFGNFALSSLLAGALAAVILLPAFASLAGGKAEFSLSVLELTVKFSPEALLSKLYVGAFNYEEIMPVGMPHIFCGTVTTTLAVLYFANSAIPRRRRILTGCFFAVLAVSFWVTALDLIWHCLNTPSWYNYRYSFLFSFLLAAAADQELAHYKEGTRPWHLALPAGLCALASLLVFAGKSYDYVTWYTAIEAVAVAALVGGALWLMLRPQAKPRTAAALALLIFIVHLADLGANAKLSLADLTLPASDSAAYAQYVTEKQAAFDLIDTGDTYTRVESDTMFDMNRCEAMLFGYDGISHYGSTISQKSLDFLDRLGFDRYTDLWALYGSGVTTAADTLLGLRYLVTAAPTKDYATLGTTDSYTVQENENALPIAWTADQAIAQQIEAADSLSYLDALYAAAAPEVGADIYTPAQIIDISLDNYDTDGTHYTRAKDTIASVTYTLTAAADGPLYGQLEIPDFPGVMVFVNNAYLAYTATAQTNGTLYLGQFQTGDTVTVKLQASADITIQQAVFATESAQAIGQYSDALSQGGCDLTKLSASHYTGTFTTGDGDSLLVFTIPYDQSWHVTLDGQSVEPMEVQDCLMAVDVTAGTHTVELRYIPTGLIPGAVICLTALAVCLGLYAWERKKKKKDSQK
jgi:uncharacterized membrane protein YfhO